jgi:hypothetical protein
MTLHYACAIQRDHRTEIMNIDRINKAWTQAQQASDQLGVYSPSLDALFVAAYLSAEQAPKFARATTSEPPEWFIRHVYRLAGRTETAASVMRLAQGSEPSLAESRQCGIWLRAMGCTPYKSNGVTKFRLPPA